MINLPREKTVVLKAEDKDYDRGLLVRLLEDGGYRVASVSYTHLTLPTKRIV